MIIVIFLFYALILVSLVTAAVLFNSAHKNRQPNLYWLSIFFFFAAVNSIFIPLEGSPPGETPASLWLNQILSIGVRIALIIFIHTTFYTNKSTPAGWIMAITLLLMAMTFYGVAVTQDNFNQSPWIAGSNVATILIWAWHFWIGYQGWRSVAHEAGVADWVKARYQMMVAYSLLTVIGGAASVIRVVFAGGVATTALGNIMGVVSLLCQFVSVALQFLTWVLPEGFRRWLNRNYQEAPEEAIVLE